LLLSSRDPLERVEVRLAPVGQVIARPVTRLVHALKAGVDQLQQSSRFISIEIARCELL
jgi:hypothetical protein